MKSLPPLLFIIFFQAQSQILPISKAEFEQASFKSLDLLKEELKEVKIVGLGEALHYMGGTYTAKIKMVKFLHEQCGFDVLAFESPLYNMSKVNELVKKDTVSLKYLRRNISGVWNSLEMMELFKYVIETQKTDRPLEYTGFDEAFFSSEEGQNLTADYSSFVEYLSKKSKISIELDSSFYNAIETVAEKCYFYSKRSPEDTLLMYHKFKLIRSAMDQLNYKDDPYLYYWRLITDNLQSVYRKNYQLGNREQCMAKNATYLAKVKYPDKKIILWAATVHLLPNKHVTANSEIKTNLDGKKTMGDFLKNKFGKQYYLMAFSPGNGKVGSKGYLGLASRKVRSKKGSIEYYINEKYACDYAYVNLRQQNVRNQIKENNIEQSNIIWMKGLKYNGEKMNIAEAADAIFYLKEDHLVTY